MENTTEAYSLKEIFDKWEEQGYAFSERARDYPPTTVTTLSTCGRCEYGIFRPTVLGTDLFYQELSRMGSSWYYLPYKWEYQQALSDLKRGNKVLDIGCGQGFFLERCQDDGIVAEGIELNANAAAIARAKGFMVYEQMLDEFSDKHKDHYDAVCLFQVLEHLEKPVDVVSQALKCINPGGLLIIGVPNMDGILKKMRNLPANVPPHHVSRWTQKSLRSLAAKFDLKMVDIRFEPVYQHLPGFLQERFFNRLPSFLKRNKLWLALLYLPSRFLSLIKPKGLESLPGHTVYAIFKKYK